MRCIARFRFRTIGSLAGVVLLSACTVHFPDLHSAPQTGDVQVVSVQSPTATATPIIDAFISVLQGPTSTPTPNVLTPQPSNYLPSPTPMSVTVVLNETEGLPDSKIWVVVVRRADGRYEELRLPIQEVPRDSNEHYREFRDNLIQLRPGDDVVQQGPPNYRGRNPANPSEQATSAAPVISPDVEANVTPAAQGQPSTQPAQKLSLPFIANDSQDE